MVDTEQFWKDDELAHEENCFSKASPQVALGIGMSDECVFAELGEKGDPWNVLPIQRRIELNKRYNDKAEKIVGKRLLRESFDEDTLPPIRRIGEIFGGVYSYGDGTGEWLHSDIDTPEKLEKQLDYIDKLDIRSFILPDNWEKEKTRIFETYGRKPETVRSVRGPVTLAMSIYGVENLVFLYYDAPELFSRFSQTIKDVILKIVKIMDAEAEVEGTGFAFADDNCSMLNEEMYEIFGYPVLRDVFAECSPGKDDNRYQHSDSEMGHLLPILGRLNLTGCNFGPTILIDEIRKHMPHTRIDGCLAPFAFMNNDAEAIKAEVIRDCKMIKETGTKGLNLSTAGSINNGSSLASMRLIMELIQEHGRY